MTAILLVKTSSLGDVVHNLPVVTDIRRRFPDARIDWVVEEHFAAIPRCHCGVRDVIPVAVRRWRRTWWQHATREAIGRVRARLAAQALGYARDGAAEYGIQRAPSTTAAPYVVLLHATSAERKLWPETAWIALAKTLAARGLDVVLPWGNAEERARSERLAQAMARARVPERMTLDVVADLLGGARLVVGLDTGLTHWAGALGVPTLGIYVATDPAATGLYACPLGRNLGTIGQPPAVDDVVAAAMELLAR